MTDWLGRWSYPGIFVCVFIGNFGIPVPEEVVLLAAGFLARRHVLELGTLYIIAIRAPSQGTRAALGWTNRWTMAVRVAFAEIHISTETHEHLRTFFSGAWQQGERGRFEPPDLSRLRRQGMLRTGHLFGAKVTNISTEICSPSVRPDFRSTKVGSVRPPTESG